MRMNTESDLSQTKFSVPACNVIVRGAMPTQPDAASDFNTEKQARTSQPYFLYFKYRVYFMRKKIFPVKGQSHKEFYDWEGNKKEDYERQLYDDKKAVPTDRQGVNDDKSKKNKSTFQLTWGGFTSADEGKISKFGTQGVITRSSVKKRDPNATSTATWDNKISKKKSLAAFTESEDFALSTKATVR